MINNRQAGRRNRGRNNNNNGRPSGQNRGGGDSGNRIDSRSRGNAAQLLEKYRNMARDAQLSGDRVNVEYYLQFADHYFRVLADNRARQEEQNPQRARREDSSFEDNGDDFDNNDDFGMDYMADRTPPPRQEPRQDNQRNDNGRQDGARYDGPRQDRQDNGQRNDNNRQDGNRQDGQRQDYQPREQRADRGEQQDGQGNQRNRNRNNRDRDYTRQPQEFAAAPAPVEAPAPRQEFVAEQPHVAPEEAAPKPRRGRKPKAETAPETDVQEGLDLTVLPPAISRADNDSDGEETPAPKRRGRPRRTPAAEAAE